MKYIWSESIDVILKVGYSLEEFGVCNWGLESQLALAAIDKLLIANIAILGGDVYVLDGSVIKSTHNNWYCEKESQEHYGEFVNRSVGLAKKYIASFKDSDAKFIFAIVPSV